MLTDSWESTCVDSSLNPATLREVVDEYATYARRVRNLDEGTVKKQHMYLDRFLAAQLAELLGVDGTEPA